MQAESHVEDIAHGDSCTQSGHFMCLCDIETTFLFFPRTGPYSGVNVLGKTKTRNSCVLGRLHTMDCVKIRTHLCRTAKTMLCAVGVSTTDMRNLKYKGLTKVNFNLTGYFVQPPGTVIELQAGERNFITYIVKMEDTAHFDQSLSLVQKAAGSELDSSRSYYLDLPHLVSHHLILFLVEMKSNATNQVQTSIHFLFMCCVAFKPLTLSPCCSKHP